MRRANLNVKPYKSETSPWCIDLREGRKRKRLFFTSKSAADQELVRIKTKMRREGEDALRLSDATRIAALEGERRLAAFGKDLRYAIEFALKHLESAQKSVSISVLAGECLNEQKRIGRSAVHLTDLRNRYAAFCEAYGGTPTRTLTSEQVQDWLWNLKLSPVSVNNFRTRLGSLFGYAVKHGYMDRNPVESIEKMKVVDKPVEILTVDELAALLEHASADVLPLLAIGAFAGIRTAELLRLNWQDINLKTGFLNVAAAKSKTAQRRLIKMEPCLQSWLAPYSGKTGPIFSGNNVFVFLNDVRGVAKAAGVRIPKNALRHSFASYHIAKYQDAAKLALDMGHTTTKLIFSNYRELVTPEEAERYFNIFPPAQAENVVPMAKVL
jgi:integrase